MTTQAEQLNLVVSRLFARLRDHLVEQGVSLPQARVLSRLRDHGPARITDLATGLQVSQPTMTGQVRRLEHAGWVARSADTTDGRAVMISLTPLGRDVLAALVRSRAALLDVGMGRLDPPDHASIDAALPALQRLADALESRDAYAGSVRS